MAPCCSSLPAHSSPECVRSPQHAPTTGLNGRSVSSQHIQRSTAFASGISCVEGQPEWLHFLSTWELPCKTSLTSDEPAPREVTEQRSRSPGNGTRERRSRVILPATLPLARLGTGWKWRTRSLSKPEPLGRLMNPFRSRRESGLCQFKETSNSSVRQVLDESDLSKWAILPRAWATRRPTSSGAWRSARPPAQHPLRCMPHPLIMAFGVQS